MPTVLISGGGRGLGRALALEYIERGWQVFVTVRLSEVAKDVARVARTIYPVDVRDEGAISRVVNALAGQPLDALINNAGIYGPKDQTIGGLCPGDFLDVLNVNLVGPLRMTQALLPNLASARGKVIFIGSRSGQKGNKRANRLAYSVSKAALNRLAFSVSDDLAVMGITVASIAPGWVRTDMGGPNALLDPRHSARGLRLLIDKLSLGSTGQFWNIDGTQLDW